MPSPITWILVSALAAAGAAIVLHLARRLRRSERERERVTDELNRRLSELFSLQELSFVLSDSIQLDRIVEQVVRYAMRFLGARGALLALTGEGPAAPITVAAAEGTLAPLAQMSIARNIFIGREPASEGDAFHEQIARSAKISATPLAPKD